LEQLGKKRAEAQERYDNNPTAKNKTSLERAGDDIANATRDKEILVKGKVPAEYIIIKPKE
jgi:hypothetical protein